MMSGAFAVLVLVFLASLTSSVPLVGNEMADASQKAKAITATTTTTSNILTPNSASWRVVPDPTADKQQQQQQQQQQHLKPPAIKSAGPTITATNHLLKSVTTFASSSSAKWGQKPAAVVADLGKVLASESAKVVDGKAEEVGVVAGAGDVAVVSSASPSALPRPEVTKMMLVAICTAPNHVEHRAAIRRTWATVAQHLPPYDFDVKFFIGQVQDESLETAIQSEMTAKGDIIRIKTFESYHNLTLKTLDMIRYAYTHKYDVMLKVDDDTFVLLDNVLYDVMAYNADRSSLYWGKFWGSDDRPVDRSKGSKYYVSREEYAPDTYPNYPDGPCYAVGKDLMKWIVEREPTLRKYRLEDAAMGIWLNSAVTVPIVEQFGAAYLYQRNCPEGNFYYYVNPVKPSEMDDIMSRYGNRLDICSGNYSLAICSDPVKGCLCSPSNDPCWDRPDFQFLAQVASTVQSNGHSDAITTAAATATTAVETVNTEALTEVALAVTAKQEMSH